MKGSPEFSQNILECSPKTREMCRDRNANIASRVFRGLLLSRALVLEAFLQCAPESEHDPTLLRRRPVRPIPGYFTKHHTNL
jgi:hypothetical protein